MKGSLFSRFINFTAQKKNGHLRRPIMPSEGPWIVDLEVQEETPKMKSTLTTIQWSPVMMLQNHLQTPITKEIMNHHGTRIIQIMTRKLDSFFKPMEDMWITRTFGARAAEVYKKIGEEQCTRLVHDAAYINKREGYYTSMFGLNNGAFVLLAQAAEQHFPGSTFVPPLLISRNKKGQLKKKGKKGALDHNGTGVAAHYFSNLSNNLADLTSSEIWTCGKRA